MEDREPLYPGRIKLTPVSGQANVYDSVRADQPVKAGTPLNKNTFLKDTTAALFGKTSAALPDEIFQILANAALYKNGEIVTPGGITVPNVKIELGSYVGTGAFGQSNPSSITFSFPFDIAILFGESKYGSISHNNNSNWMISKQQLNANAYTYGTGFSLGLGGSSYGKTSLDGKTFLWYTQSTEATSQANEKNITYYYGGIVFLGG